MPSRLAKAVFALSGLSALAVGAAEAASVASAEPPTATPAAHGATKAASWTGEAVTRSLAGVRPTFAVPAATP